MIENEKNTNYYWVCHEHTTSKNIANYEYLLKIIPNDKILLI